jgi:hypothetical protein
MDRRLRRARAVRLACLAGLGVCLLACARTNRYSGWAVSRSRNVAVYTDAKLEHEFIQEWLELSHAALQAFFPGVRTGTVDVVWLKNQPGSGTRFYRPWDDPRSGWTLQSLPSVSDGRIGREGLIVLERAQVSGPNQLHFTGVRDENLAKEQMAHLFIMKATPSAPLWLQVGLGRYLQNYRIHYRGNFWLACFGSPVFDEPAWPGVTGGPADTPGIRAGSTGDGRRVTMAVADVLAADWYDYDGRQRRWYEYTTYALVHYLIHGENGFNRSRFPMLLDAFRAGKHSAEALALAYPHILPEEWDERLSAHVRPPRSRAFIAAMPEISQGLCFQIPPAHHADKKPRREKANARDIHVLMTDLEQVDPFRRHSGWWPQDIVEAEASKRKRQPGPDGERGGPGREGAERGPQGNQGRRGQPDQSDKAGQRLPDEGDTPTIRVPAPSPP